MKILSLSRVDIAWNSWLYIVLNSRTPLYIGGGKVCDPFSDDIGTIYIFSPFWTVVSFPDPSPFFLCHCYFSFLHPLQALFWIISSIHWIVYVQASNRKKSSIELCLLEGEASVISLLTWGEYISAVYSIYIRSVSKLAYYNFHIIMQTKAPRKLFTARSAVSNLIFWPDFLCICASHLSYMWNKLL